MAQRTKKPVLTSSAVTSVCGEQAREKVGTAGGVHGHVSHRDAILADRHPDLKAGFMLANQPFKTFDWGGECLAGDQRRQYGAPPKGDAVIVCGP